MKKRGLFISVEGIDGAGKSTHVRFIQEYLQQNGKDVITTREPGGTELGEKIRDLLLHHNKAMHKITELLLMFASRQELIHNIIEPSLNDGICVIADRFIDASIAYQGAGRGVGIENIKKIISILDPVVNTDLTILFDTTLDVAFGRITRNRNKDRIENETADFFATVQQAYRDIALKDPKRVKIITTDQHIDKTRELIVQQLDILLGIE